MNQRNYQPHSSSPSREQNYQSSRHPMSGMGRDFYATDQGSSRTGEHFNRRDQPHGQSYGGSDQNRYSDRPQRGQQRWQDRFQNEMNYSQHRYSDSEDGHSFQNTPQRTSEGNYDSSEFEQPYRDNLESGSYGSDDTSWTGQNRSYRSSDPQERLGQQRSAFNPAQGQERWSSYGSQNSTSSDAHRSSSQQPRRQFSGVGPKGYRRSDERVREDVCETIASHGDIDASEVEVEVSEGIVTLSGTVNSRQMKRMIEDCVEDLSGVKDVKNQIQIQTQTQSKGSSSKSETKAETKADSSDESSKNSTHSAKTNSSLGSTSATHSTQAKASK